MARTRSSLRAGNSSEAAPPSNSPAVPASAAVKRPRGRPSKAPLAAASSSKNTNSSNSTSTYSESASGYSTPLTSNVPTPAPEKSTGSEKFTIVLPSVNTRRNQEEALQKAKNYMLGTDSKPAVLADLTDGEISNESPGFNLTRHDEEVARRLQEEIYREVEDEYNGKSDVESSLSNLSVDGDGDSDIVPSAKAKGKGRAVPTLPRRSGRKSIKPVIADSEDDLYDYEPPAKRLKNAKGKGVDTAPQHARRSNKPSFFDSEDDLSESADHELPPEKPKAVKGRAKGKTIPTTLPNNDDDGASSAGSALTDEYDVLVSYSSDSEAAEDEPTRVRCASRRGFSAYKNRKGVHTVRAKLEGHHPQLKTMWIDLENMPRLKSGRAEQPKAISRILKPFQLEGLAWMRAMEETPWKGGLLGDEMGLGKTIQAVSLIMSDYPAKQPTLVLVPPVALMQWVNEIASYTDGKLKTLVYHGTNSKVKLMSLKELKRYDVIMMSYNSLESLYRKQEKGFKRKAGMVKETSLIHAITFHRVILDEAHCIKTRTTMTAKACFELKAKYRWCLTGTPLQNRIGEFFSLIRFLDIQPFASYFCKHCDCESLTWEMDDDHRCVSCKHSGMQHISVFNQELLNPIQRYGNVGPGAEAFRKLRMLTDRIMLRRLKKDHTNSMELPVKEVFVDRQFFGEAENDLANSIMTNGQRNFDTYVAQGVLLNNYANIFGLIMQMRQVADHPDLILKKNAAGGQNILQCNICDEPAEEAIRSRCKHDFCRACAQAYLNSQDQPDCPRCHIPLSIDLEQPAIEQDEELLKKSSIINRIRMENWTSSSKIELLVRELHKLRSDKATHKSIIFSQFTTMLQLIEWRLRRAGITTVMLDGSMTPAQRAASIDHFMKNVEVECFLVSLKAGGVALNLTEASHVFIVDPWWNPAAEWQSADRCHRIGQTRPCTITRLCIEDSVESRMVLLQEKKTNMINSTINSDDAAMESLSPEDLQFLFRGS